MYLTLYVLDTLCYYINLILYVFDTLCYLRYYYPYEFLTAFFNGLFLPDTLTADIFGFHTWGETATDF